jgi:hypothetical protein
LQCGDGVEHERDAGLHVEHAGAVEAVVGDVAGHGGERAERIDGVEVAEEENRLPALASLNLALIRGKSICRLSPKLVAG